MKEFDNDKYTILIANLMNDFRYAEVSNMSKMYALRKQAEVICRKILDLGDDYAIMLGQIRFGSKNTKVKESLDSLDVDLAKELIKVTQIVNGPGSQGTHTQRTEEFSDNEVAIVEEGILDLYALLFVKFFIDIDININMSATILRTFSFLPPIIRYKVWEKLYERNSSNIVIADRLCLAIIKAFDKNEAYKWLNDNRDKILGIPYPSEEEIQEYLWKHSVEVAPGDVRAVVTLNFPKYTNMYDLLIDKVDNSATSLNEAGKMYSDFEEALIYYRSHRQEIDDGVSEDEKRFIDLTDFVFIGRKTKGK